MFEAEHITSARLIICFEKQTHKKRKEFKGNNLINNQLLGYYQEVPLIFQIQYIFLIQMGMKFFQYVPKFIETSDKIAWGIRSSYGCKETQNNKTTWPNNIQFNQPKLLAIEQAKIPWHNMFSRSFQTIWTTPTFSPSTFSTARAQILHFPKLENTILLSKPSIAQSHNLGKIETTQSPTQEPPTELIELSTLIW